MARSHGRDAEVLNAEAELIEKWLEVQRQAAEDSFDLLRTIPGIEVEPAFQEAYGSLVCRSAGDYTGKPFLFEDTEALARSVMRYACMIARPYRARMAYLMAKAKLSEHDDDPNSTEAARARQTYQRKKNLVSKRILQIQERRTHRARRTMMEACLGLRNHFGPRFKPDASASCESQLSDEAESCEGWQLKMRHRPRF